MASFDITMVLYDVRKSINSRYTKVIKYELNKWKINY